LRASPLFREIRRLAKTGVPVIGICGGYQMLGKLVRDSGIENGVAEDVKGLGLLPVTTRFGAYEKHTCQVVKPVTGTGPILEPIWGCKLLGYEIHMGQTDSGRRPLGRRLRRRERTIIGTYMHGFENESFRDAICPMPVSAKVSVSPCNHRRSHDSSRTQSHRHSMSKDH
jgi:adenosylcobyric acid synthase